MATQNAIGKASTRAAISHGLFSLASIVVGFALTLAAASAGAQDRSPAADAVAAEVSLAQAKLDREIAALGIAKLDVGVSVRDLEAGESVVDSVRIVTPENQGDWLLRAASTMKLFTTAAALETLGSDHQIVNARFVRGRVGDLVHKINKVSDNTRAQSLFLYMGRRKSGRVAGTAGVAALRGYLESIGISGTFHLGDGSGQSSSDKFSPSQLTHLLAHMTASDEYRTFRDSLPVAGEAGATLSDRFLGLPRADRALLSAKTGHTSGANTLAGYVGERYAFAILVNRYGIDASAKATAAIHRFMEEVVRALLKARLAEPPVPTRDIAAGNGEDGHAAAPGAVTNLGGIGR
ncbi:MAG: D-alanyl-D-alanine carboxypeptidase [Planctomycetes bacterium]|nr:D-alanyl-D-alanine carboxypeptidase [Planctomycetota bacterium]